MKKLIFDKRGSEKLFSIWWLFVLIIVGIGIIAGVYIFYSAEVNIKEVEAELLSNKLMDCIVEQGFLIEDIFEKNFDISKKCSINQEVIESGDFYFNISLYDENKKLLRESIFLGTSSFEKHCQVVEETKEAKKYPMCFERIEKGLYSEEGKLKEVTIKVLAGSNQKGGKISITS